MNPTQRKTWQAIQSRLRHGQSVEQALQDCHGYDIPVAGVVRHHFGKPGDPQYNTSEDVSGLYGINAGASRHAPEPAHHYAAEL